MRVKLKSIDSENLFQKLFESRDINDLARIAGVSSRSIREWKRGKVSMPVNIFDKFVAYTELFKLRSSAVFLDDFWHNKEAGRRGGLSRIKLHGNPATKEGRQRGGHKSLLKHKEKKTNFKVLREIFIPTKSTKLAELLGIFIGDGHLSNYQASIYTNLSTDKDHAFYVKNLLDELFKIGASIKERKRDNSVIVTAYSKNLVGFINSLGMPVGNKLNKNLHIPKWILENEEFKKSFIRGIFDTDGCVFVDRHRHGNKVYENIGLAITSSSRSFLVDLMFVLKELGLNPSNRTSQHSVFIRRKNDVLKYFEIVNTNNNKHKKRYNDFINGRVPKWS